MPEMDGLDTPAGHRFVGCVLSVSQRHAPCDERLLADCPKLFAYAYERANGEVLQERSTSITSRTAIAAAARQ